MYNIKTKEMSKNKKMDETLDRFIPCYSVSLLYKKVNNIALRVFISDAKNEKDALNEATRIYSWSIHNYKLVEFVAAKLDQTQYETL